MFVCELDEAVGDVSPSVETNYLGLHVPAGRLKVERVEGYRLTERGGNTSLHKPLISQETWLLCVLVKLCCYDRLTRAATALLIR